MVKGKPISFNSKFQEELAMFLDYPLSGGSPYYPDFNILRDLIQEVSNSISIKVDNIKKEIALENEDVAGSMSSQYYSVLNNYYDLAYKSIFIMIYSSFENCLSKIEILLLSHRLNKNFRLQDTLNLFASKNLLAKINNNNKKDKKIKESILLQKKVTKLNEIRNVIAHNNSIVPEKRKFKDLIEKIKKHPAILFKNDTRELVIIDIQFLYDSVNVFQSILNEIYKNSKS